MPIFGRSTPPEEEPQLPARDLEYEAERVVEWRRFHLEGLGIPYPLALELAVAGVDWHRVANAIDRGATHDQIERIFL